MEFRLIIFKNFIVNKDFFSFRILLFKINCLDEHRLKLKQISSFKIFLIMFISFQIPFLSIISSITSFQMNNLIAFSAKEPIALHRILLWMSLIMTILVVLVVLLGLWNFLIILLNCWFVNLSDFHYFFDWNCLFDLSIYFPLLLNHKFFSLSFSTQSLMNWRLKNYLINYTIYFIMYVLTRN